MLDESHLKKYADVLLWGLKTARRGRFRKRDVILLQYDRAALSLAEILYEKIIAAGMIPAGLELMDQLARAGDVALFVWYFIGSTELDGTGTPGGTIS